MPHPPHSRNLEAQPIDWLRLFMGSCWANMFVYCLTKPMLCTNIQRGFFEQQLLSQTTSGAWRMVNWISGHCSWSQKTTLHALPLTTDYGAAPWCVASRACVDNRLRGLCASSVQHCSSLCLDNPPVVRGQADSTLVVYQVWICSAAGQTKWPNSSNWHLSCPHTE